MPELYIALLQNGTFYFIFYVVRAAEIIRGLKYSLLFNQGDTNIFLPLGTVKFTFYHVTNNLPVKDTTSLHYYPQ